MRHLTTILATLLALGASAALAEEFVVLDNGARIPIRKAIPVISESNGASGWHTSVSRPRQESHLHKGTRTSHQGFHVDYRIAPESAPQMGYDLDAGFRMLDSMIGDSIDSSLARNMQISQGGHLRWTGPNRLELTLSSTLETALHDTRSYQEHAVVHKGLLSYAPLPHTPLRTSLGSGDRRRLDGTILHEDALSTSLEQRVPLLPLRLTLTQSSAWQSLVDSDDGDIERHRLLGSALWNIQEGTTLSLGVESGMVSRATNDSSELTSIISTELRLQPLPLLGLRLGASAEDRGIPAPADEGCEARVLIPALSAGLDLQLAPNFETGIGILYRPNAPATPTNSSAAPAQVAIFGSTLF
jgi:hypothetical protein